MKEYKDLEFICQNCGKSFIRSERSIIKNKGIEPKFCCLKCSQEYHRKASEVIVKCEYCGKEKTIKKGEYNKSESKIFFCDNSCAAKYNNHKRAKEEHTDEKYYSSYDTCPICGKEKLKTSEMCVECYNTRYDRSTLGEVIGDGKYATHKCSTIRKRARGILEKSGTEKVCAYCHNHEYDDILEVHHLKGIMTFPRETKISEINSEDNLVWLCPNHHKMLEMGLIKLDKDNTGDVV